MVSENYEMFIPMNLFELFDGKSYEEAVKNLKDFVDTAALINDLDLVLSVDTSVAHLSGALEKKTLLLLPCVPDWRWLLDRTDSPWYPSMRLYRQARIGDWNGVLDKVKFDLNGDLKPPISTTQL